MKTPGAGWFKKAQKNNEEKTEKKCDKKLTEKNTKKPSKNNTKNISRKRKKTELIEYFAIVSWTIPPKKIVNYTQKHCQKNRKKTTNCKK